MKRILLSAGPIPAKIDSVKILTNLFKGGLAVRTAESLATNGDFDVEIVKWKGTPVCFRDAESEGRILVTSVEDLSLR